MRINVCTCERVYVYTDMYYVYVYVYVYMYMYMYMYVTSVKNRCHSKKLKKYIFSLKCLTPDAGTYAYLKLL